MSKATGSVAQDTSQRLVIPMSGPDMPRGVSGFCKDVFREFPMELR
jgi:hypothetical protein